MIFGPKSTRRGLFGRKNDKPGPQGPAAFQAEGLRAPRPFRPWACGPGLRARPQGPTAFQAMGLRALNAQLEMSWYLKPGLGRNFTLN